MARFKSTTCTQKNSVAWVGARCDLCGDVYVEGQMQVTLNFVGYVGQAMKDAGRMPVCHDRCLAEASGLPAEERRQRKAVRVETAAAKLDVEFEEMRKLAARRVGVS